jgi:hypothetical protein
MNERELLDAAVKLSAVERTRFLDLACKDDPELRKQVEAIFKAHFDSASLFARPAQCEETGSRRREANGSHPGFWSVISMGW